MNSSNNRIMSGIVIALMIASTLFAGVSLVGEEVKAGLLDPEIMVADEPTSNITGLLFPYWNNTGSIEVPWQAADNNDLANVSLMYDYSTDNTTWDGWAWDNINAASSTTAFGNFTFNCPQGGGFYQLRTNATDALGNAEVNLTDIVEFAYVSYQPDLMINGTADDVYDMPGGGGGGPPAQFIMESVNRSEYKSYDITVQNDGPVVDKITVLFMLDMDPSWDFWVWDLDNSTNMTQYIYGQPPMMGGIDTYLNISLNPTETRSYSINITVASDAPFGQTGAQILFGVSEGAMDMGVYGPDGPPIAMDMVISMLQTYRADYIKITDAPDGTDIANQTINSGVTIQGYASAYSNDPVVGYLGLAKVNWTLVNYSGAAATNANPTLSTEDVFNANAGRGYAHWQAEYVYSYLDMDDELEIYWVNSTIVNITIIAPTITLTSPADGDTEVLVGADIVITFDEQMNTGTVTYTCAPNPGGWGAGVWSGVDTVLTLTHADFATDTLYTFEVTAGQDVAGNALAAGAAPNPWTFTTVDTIDPTITLTSPANITTGVLVGADVVITFDEPMNTVTVTYTCAPDPNGWGIAWSAGDTVLTLSHTAFASETTYTFTVTAGDDVAGNSLAAGAVPNPFNFTTEDIIAPEITVTSPADGATDVAVTAGTYVIEFSESMDTSITANQTNLPGAVGAWDLTGMWFNITYTALAESTTYYVNLSFQGHNDLAGNPLVEHNNTFTTGEFTAPEIVDDTGSAATTGDSFTFQVNVTDDSNITEVKVVYWYGTGAKTNTTMANTADDDFELTISIPGNSVDTLHYQIFAMDEYDNWILTAVSDVLVTDNDVPTAAAGQNQTVVAGTLVGFNASDSSDSIGIVNYTWNFT
ncbi:MAG: Ig-like domain-containing protein, partial [Thermoplasmata archaeon]|nr:Ig-like domain-containing protein [Thermoplasmata archaeon]